MILAESTIWRELQKSKQWIKNHLMDIDLHVMVSITFNITVKHCF